MESTEKRVTLLLGGARSGKSRYAQTLAAQAGRVLFVATAQAGDEEMRSKIARHQADRLADRLEWTLAEEPLHVAEAIRQQGPGHGTIVVDCLTLWAANLLELDPEERTAHTERLCATLAEAPCPLVLVSNEVGSGVVPDFPSGRVYRDLLGELNQRVAGIATEVFLLVAGLPLRLKGDGQ